MPQGDAFRRPSSDYPSSHPGSLPQLDSDADIAHAGPLERVELNAFDEAFVRCYPAASRYAMDVLLRALPRVTDGMVLEGQAAFDYLIALRQGIVAVTVEVASRYSSATWLHLIRTLSPRGLSFAESGTMEHRGDSTQRVAENIVGRSDGQELDLTSTTVSTSTSMSLAKLMALAGLVDGLEGAVRSASKGLKFTVRRHRRPRPVDSDGLLAALREFDLRSSWSSADGYKRLQDIATDDFDGDPPMLVAYRFTNGMALDQVWDGPFRSAQPSEEVVQFTVRAFTTGDKTYTVLGRHGVLETFERPAVTASLIIFGNALLHHVLHLADSAGMSLPQLGLMWIDTETLLAETDAAFRRSAAASWLAENGQAALTSAEVLMNVRELYAHGRRSFPGPMLQEREGRTLVDVWAYAWHITDGLKLSPQTGGAVANLSAEQFELATQELIDSSVLAPPPALRELRGRVLRLNGRPVTDVDAVLVAEQKLFLVSCKKFTIRVDYLAGEYAAARNGTTRLNDALDEWRDRVATLRAHPVGDNYDFTGYDLEGFVVLPQLVFTPREDSRELLRFGKRDLFFTRVESFSQFAAALEMAGWPDDRP